MARISGNDIRPGMVIEHDGGLWVAVKTEKVKPGKGPAYNQVELKNLIDGRKLNNRFGSDDRVEETSLEYRDFQYLYKEADQLVFMNNETYEQIELAEDFVGDRAAFLQDGMTVTLQMHQERPDQHPPARAGDAHAHGGRSGGQEPDGGLVLQARPAGERPAHPGAALRRGGGARGRQHRRHHLRPPRGLNPAIPTRRAPPAGAPFPEIRP